MKKTVDVFVQDHLVASYPVILEASDPTEEDFIDRIRRYMRRHYSKEDSPPRNSLSVTQVKVELGRLRTRRLAGQQPRHLGRRPSASNLKRPTDVFPR
jgi:hypothetical protein